MDTKDIGVYVYDRQTLIQYKNHAATNLHDDVLDKLRDLGLLRGPGLRPSASPDAGGREMGRRKRCARKRKRGKRAGVRARLKTNPSRPSLPSILLSNVRSLDNKLDYIRLQRTARREYRDCCVFVFTETWLSDRVPDAGIQLDGLAAFRADRDASLCGKSNDPALLPEVCSHYNKGSGLFGACTFKENCTKVHMCQHFVQDNCIFGTKCKRLHCIDQYGRRMLEERGLGGDVIQDLPFLYQNVHRMNASAADAERVSEPINRSLELIEEKNEICLHFIRRNCKFQEQCKLVHFNLPYKWEVNEGNGWRDLQGMEGIERAFCDPRNTYGPGSRPVDFQTMTKSGHPVHRLSTVSSISKPSHYVLTTHWLWYYKGDHNNWIEYGRPDDKHRVTSVKSCDLEEAFLMDSKANVTVIKGNRQYYVSFEDMYQRNPKHNTKRKVRRRPCFLSISKVESQISL